MNLFLDRPTLGGARRQVSLCGKSSTSRRFPGPTSVAGSIDPEEGPLRSVRVVLLAILMSACSGSASSPPTSLDGHPLSELLPASVNGVETTKKDMSVVHRANPRVFLKTLGRLGKTPPDAEMALAYESGASATPSGSTESAATTFCWISSPKR